MRTDIDGNPLDGPKAKKPPGLLAQTSSTAPAPQSGGLQSALSSMPSAAQSKVGESMTSAGRLNKMLGEDSPLMKQARTQGLQTAQQRGLLNSSMAVGAAQGAMIERASPFALQDSSNLINNEQFNAGQKNQFGLLKSSLIGDSYLSNQNYDQQLGLNEQAYGFERGLNDQKQGFQQDNLRLQDDIQQTQMELQNALGQGDMNLANQLQQRLNEQKQAFDQENMRLGDTLDRGQMELGDTLQRGQNQQQAEIQAERDQMLFGFETQNMEKAAEIQAERDVRLADLDADLAQLQSQLQEAQAQNDFGRVKELTDKEAGIQETRDRLMFTQQEEKARNDLARELEKMGVQFDLSQMETATNFSSNVAMNTLEAVQNIQADPNLKPDAKKAAVTNALDVANETMSWGAKFYKTQIPGMRTPAPEQSAQPTGDTRSGRQGRVDEQEGGPSAQREEAPMYGPASEPMTQTQIRGAIERMYRQDLGRDPDQGAMMWWADHATRNNWSEEQLTSAMRAAAVANNDNPPPR